MNGKLTYLSLYLCLLLILQSCAGIDPAVDFEAYRQQSLAEKLSKAQSAIKDNNHTEALYWYQIAQSIDSSNEEISQEISRLQAILKKRAQRYFSRAEKAQREGRYQRASTLFQRALVLQPENTLAVTKLRELDLRLMLMQKGKNALPQEEQLHADVQGKNTQTDPVISIAQQQSVLLQQAMKNYQVGDLVQSATQAKQAKEMGELTPEGKKQAAIVLLGLSKSYLEIGDVESAYLYYKESKESVSNEVFSLLSPAGDLSISLAERLYILGKDFFPNKIKRALYYWEACADVDQNYSDINRLLTMARRYKYRLESVGHVQ